MTAQETKKSYWLYVLKLEQGKYYVGITSKTPEIRMKQHQNNFLAAEWGKLYPPMSILDKRDLGVITYSQAEEYENKVVRKYIKQYGIDNVRGGDLSYRGKYFVRFGLAFVENDWLALTTVVLLLLIIVALTLDKYL
jgi:predicted GIY-YIG superfamily endonuclease